MKSRLTATLILIAAAARFAPAQDRTLGLFLNVPEKTAPGYVLLPPMHNGHTYLIDNNGQVVHSWYAGNSEPGRMTYLLPNGHLLRSVSLPNTGPNMGGGDGGRITEYDWDGNLVWQFDYSNSTTAIHHDLKYLPNGNVIMLMVETKTLAEMSAAGFRPNILQQGATALLPDAIIEVQPTRPVGGQIVWEWHVWDHLVQSYDPSKANYGNPALHPELVDPNASGQIASFWNHMNSIDYNAALDQIMVSVRGNSEFWVIDHSTTKAEAAGHSGGKYGKGGDLLYRWGNPAQYGAGKSADRMLYEQHDAQWIAAGRPGAGNILVFNNGDNRPSGNYSSVDEISSPVDSAGNYPRSAGSAYLPSTLAWTYFGTGSERYYDADVSGAERQPNGNTLICYGTHGVLEEVTAGGELVWKYMNPVVQTGPLRQGQTPGLDQKNQSLAAVFKVRRYAPDYPGLAGRDLTPIGPVEQYSVALVGAAGMQAGVASPGGILTLFGNGMADSIAVAGASLPTTLGGVTVQITDSAGAVFDCPLFYASPTQINLLIPSGVALGAATLSVRKSSGLVAWVSTSVEPVAPGLFAANASGRGVGAIVGLRVDSAGARSDVPIFQYDSSVRQYVAAPIDLGVAGDGIYLSLYGTGFRNFSSASAINVSVGGIAVPVLGAAAQSQYQGLDQVNIGPLPRALAGRGEVNILLQVDGRSANAVTVNIK